MSVGTWRQKFDSPFLVHFPLKTKNSLEKEPTLQYASAKVEKLKQGASMKQLHFGVKTN